MTRILAVSSGGGHWEELMLLRDAFDGAETVYATTFPDLAERAGIHDAHVIPDCSRDALLANLRCLVRAFQIVRRVRPDYVISTGAAPGLLCIMAGRLFGARTLWIESFANAERLSMCGSLSRWLAHRTMVQWAHLARPGGPVYVGALL